MGRYVGGAVQRSRQNVGHTLKTRLQNISDAKLLERSDGIFEKSEHVARVVQRELGSHSANA
jgi:hypothetical protein